MRNLKSTPLTKAQIITTSSVFFGYNIFFFVSVISLVVSFQALRIFQSGASANKLIFFTTALFFLQFCTSFMMLVSYGYCQIKSLNNFLTTVNENICKKKVYLPKVITQASKIYDNLCDLHDAISKYYLLNNLIFLMGFSYYLVVFSYSLYVYLENPTIGLRNYLLTVVLWCSYYAPCMAWMLTLSSWIENEGDKTDDLIQLLANKEKKLKTLKSSSIMMLQSKHRRPKITCELFDLNWKILFVIISGVFSFSIISIQFYDVSKN